MDIFRGRTEMMARRPRGALDAGVASSCDRLRASWNPYRFARLPLVAFLLAALPTIATAGSVTISGSPFGTNGVVSFPGYGDETNQHNVAGFSPSGISTLNKGAGWYAQGQTGPVSMVVSTLPFYKVDWYFNGAESGDKIRFTSGAISFAEGDQNNNLKKNNNDPGWHFLGATTGSGAGAPIPFSVFDETKGSGLINGVNNNPGALIASLMFAYVEPEYSRNGTLKGWKITKTPTDWFAFGFDDPGSRNNDHDDYVGIGHVSARMTQTPIPGALPLMATILGAGFAMRRWRARRASAASQGVIG
jgi:hypothetical protein